MKWKKISEATPTNINKLYPNSPETPFVSCLVWVCNPKYPSGGVFESIRWDTKNKCWFEPDMVGFSSYGLPLEITHFCDTVEPPDEAKKKHTYD